MNGNHSATSNLSPTNHTMKTLVAALTLALTSLQLVAAGENWLTDLDAAKAAARKDNKLILMDFTGSDWCPPCKKLTAEVLSQKEFLDYATKHFVLVELDFPSRKPQSDALKAANEKLKKQFAVTGFPTLVVITPDGKELWRKVGYGSGGPKLIIADLEKARKKA
jgi:thioredoxin-related protein